jgi:alpha-N-arabinofuranosidase
VIAERAGMLLSLGIAILALHGLAGNAAAAPVRISAEPLHSGRISAMLVGNFIELLDDHVPGMWAQMLNDRSFEGVVPTANGVYYAGEPNVCDRQWDRNETWTYETKRPFNGSCCARLTARNGEASLTQSGLATRKGMRYHFSAYLRSDGPEVRARVTLKTRLPDGEWMVLASAELAPPTGEWCKHTCEMTGRGTTDRAVFELAATGSGTLLADKLSLMPADNVGGWRSDVVEVIREAHPGVIRWGGSVVDPGGYRWKEGIGDRDARTPFPNRKWGRIDSNDVGIDEFCQFCEAVGAQPLICVSFSDGAQSARDLVEYCNGDADSEWGKRRAVNGHVQPYGVKYWQIGNEVVADAAYVAACLDFCRAIKQADPGAIIMSYYPSQELLDKAGRYLGYVCPHHYTGDLNYCEADLDKLTEMIRRTWGCQDIKIGITEWNVTAGDWGFGRGKLLTLDYALRNARYLNLLLRRSDVVEIACRSNMTNSFCAGMIQTNPGSLYRAPSYHVMKLYADHIKPIPVSAEGAPEGVDLAACASEDLRSVCVFAVNMNGEPVKLSLDLGAYAAACKPAASEVVCDSADLRQKDVMNHWAAPDRVRTVKLSLSGNSITLPALSASAIECAGAEEPRTAADGDVVSSPQGAARAPGAHDDAFDLQLSVGGGNGGVGGVVRLQHDAVRRSAQSL